MLSNTIPHVIGVGENNLEGTVAQYHVKDLKEFLGAIGNDRIIYIEDSINISKEIQQVFAIEQFALEDYDCTFDEYLYPREKGIFI
ncbi:hypothetical protein, partial [Tenacibaculum agarivorans]|uniref:hypothetical protein n=1 Tax=Tenacibaculum agarivorans TaxID=1908389 RepID=UPI00117CE5C3